MKLKPELARRLEKLKGLPSPPKVAMRIIEAANDPQISLARVADVVTADPVISAKIMRTANSAAYARPGGCGTLRQALVLLGLGATLIIALSFSLVLSLRRDQSDGLDLERYWRRSLLSATAARALGKVMGRSDADALFLAALLQDIGMLALDKLDTDLYRRAGGTQRDHRAVADFERRELETDHAAVGAWLMQRWQLPANVVQAIAQSHDAGAASEDGFANCVAISGLLADVWLCSDWSYSFRELVALASQGLKLNHVQIGMVLEELRDQIPETEATFEKDLIDPADGFAAMEAARELLMERGVAGFLDEPATAAQAHSSIAPLTVLRIRHRTELMEVLDAEFRGALDDGQSAGVIVAGLDGLEHIRETQGPETADRLLRETAMVMLDNVGARIVGQYAADQLVVWLEDTSQQAAELAARRTLSAFGQALSDLTGTVDISLSLALGVAALDPLHPRATVSELLDAAQVALGNARFGSVATAPETSLATSP